MCRFFSFWCFRAKHFDSLLFGYLIICIFIHKIFFKLILYFSFIMQFIIKSFTFLWASFRRSWPQSGTFFPFLSGRRWHSIKDSRYSWWLPCPTLRRRWSDSGPKMVFNLQFWPFIRLFVLSCLKLLFISKCSLHISRWVSLFILLLFLSQLIRIWIYRVWLCILLSYFFDLDLF